MALRHSPRRPAARLHVGSGHGVPRPDQLRMIYGCVIGSGWPALPHCRDFIGKVPADKVYMGK